MTVKFNDLRKLHCQIFDDEWWEKFRGMVLNSQYIGGEWVESFEKAWAKYCGAEFCISCGNGTDALELSLASILDAFPYQNTRAAIVPDMTFFATIEAVKNVGLLPVIVDIDKNGFMDNRCLDQALGMYPNSIIIPVHLWGRPGNMSLLMDIAKDHRGIILEDCAQAHGAIYQDNQIHVGRKGIAGTFSFYPGKNLGALGDGGAIITDEYRIYEHANMLKNHGKVSKFEHQIWGRNSRLDALQAYALLYKLKYLDEWNSQRIKIATLYYEGLKDLEEVWVPGEDFQGSVFHVFPILVAAIHRRGFMKYMKSKGIELGIHLPMAISQTPPAVGYPYFGAGVAKNMAGELVSLPMHPLMTSGEVNQVTCEIKKFFGERT